MQCSYHKKIHTEDDAYHYGYHAQPKKHLGCVDHCLHNTCPLLAGCPTYTGISLKCPYHKTIHKQDEYENGHQGCVQHGHCLNPTQCPLITTCPAHEGGKNLFLAWSAF
jgi:hypothetical protein